MNDPNSSFKKLNPKENEELPYDFSYIIENIPQIVVITDFRGTIEYVNSKFTQQTGYTFEEVKGKNIRILKSGKTPSSTYKKLLEIIRNGETWRGEFLNRKKNGEYYWELASISPIKNPKGVINHFFKVAENITDRKRAEEEVCGTEIHFKTIVENSYDIMSLSDLTPNLLWINPAWQNILGYSLEEIGNIFEKIHPDDCPRTLEALQLLQNKEKTVVRNLEYRIKTKYGEYVVLETNAQIINLAGKDLIFSIARDITERQKTETVIRENEEKYRAILEGIEEGYFEVDIAGNFTFFNDSLCSILRYPKDEIIGMNYRRYTDEKTAKLVYQTFNTVYRTGKPTKAFDWEVIRKDGTRGFVEISVSLITNAEGEPTGFRGIVRDISTRKQVEKALRESEEKYRKLVENSLQGIVIFQDGRIAFANKALCEMSGYCLEELLALSAEEVQAVIHPEDRARVFENIQARMEGKPVSPRYEVRAIRKNGTVYRIEIYSTIIDYQGRPAIQATQIDITERKRAEEGLRKASEEVEKLNESLKIINSILRHDLLNDLTVIQGYLELQSISKDENTLEEIFKIINKSVDLITSMGELEYLVSRNGILKPYDLKQTVGDIVKAYSTSNVKFNIEGNAKILADHALTSIINNLIQNALIHTDTERIDIKIIEQEEFCEFRVTDYGIGIPDVIKSEIFKPGFKYGKTGNTGLGLYIVKKVIERYGGAVWVENNTPKGTIFVLKLKTAN
ncbi:MAG: PAS domain S-box protein [Candidatus Hermodarchaeota archaeon]